MSIKIGDHIPAVTLKYFDENGLSDLSTDQIFKNKKVLLFAVPGAFSPTCSDDHLPGYVRLASAIKARGVDQIVCTAVNDPFVMRQWSKQKGDPESILMLPDGNGQLVEQLGLGLDAGGFGMGQRSQRYAMLVDNQVVTALQVDAVPTTVELSGAEAMLQLL